MGVLPSKELVNIPNIALIGFAAVLTVFMLHFVVNWLEE